MSKDSQHTQQECHLSTIQQFLRAFASLPQLAQAVAQARDTPGLRTAYAEYILIV